MEFRHVRNFVTIVRSASFAAASETLGLTQPGLGYQIKQLEQELGVKLLQRHSRGVYLTSAGSHFLQHAEAIISVTEQAKFAMAALASNAAQEVSIGLSPAPARTLGQLLYDQKNQNGVKFRFHEGFSEELHEEVARGALDVAVCLHVSNASLKTIPLYSEPLYLIGPKSDRPSTRSTITIAELGAYPIVVGSRSHVPRRKLEEAAARHGVKLMIDQELSAGVLRRSLVLHNGQYTVAAYGMFAAEIESGLLEARRIVEPGMNQSVHAIVASTVPPDMEQLVLASIRSVMPSIAKMAVLD